MRKSLILLIHCILLLCMTAGYPSEGAQNASTRLRILLIKTRDNAFYNPAAQGFQNGLKTRGYRSGERVELKTIALKGETAADTQSVKEQLGKNPDLIVTLGTDATRLVAEQKPTKPVLFSLVLDPISLGVAKSLEAPGGNFTGSTLLVSPGKQLDALLQALPGVHRVGVLHTAEDTTSLALIAEAQQEAKRLQIEIVATPVKKGQSAKEVWKGLSQAPEAIWIIPDPASTGPQALTETLEYARAHRLPVLGASGATVRAGALLALSASLEDLGDVTAEMATYLLDGRETPEKMRVRGPRRTLLAVNLLSARAIGLKVPDAMLRLADEVVDTEKEDNTQ
jgi:putative tryptophan/tyrosine transport system substrate-binding protein